MTRLLWLVAIGLLLSPAPARAQSEEVIYYHTDAIGSVRMITNAAGAVVARYDYAPFGEEWPQTPPTPNPDVRQYAGKERELETNLDHFPARDYRFSSGRFTIVDPDHVNGNVFDPQSWNSYAYANNNPFRFVDPEGTDYRVNVFDGNPFWVDTDRDLSWFSQGGFSFRGGNIFNAGGTRVGTYNYFSPFERTLFDAGRMADAGVRYSADLVASNFIGTGAAVGLRWGAEALVIAAEARAAQAVAAASARQSIAGVVRQIAQGTTKGKVFRNFEGQLPAKAAGYYREYTVPLAGQVGRGASRLVRGAAGEIYYTADHYATFLRIQ